MFNPARLLRCWLKGVTQLIMLLHLQVLRCRFQHLRGLYVVIFPPILQRTQMKKNEESAILSIFQAALKKQNLKPLSGSSRRKFTPTKEQKNSSNVLLAYLIYSL